MKRTDAGPIVEHVYDVAQPLREETLKSIVEDKSLTELSRPACAAHLSGACMSAAVLMAATLDAKIAF